MSDTKHLTSPPLQGANCQIDLDRVDSTLRTAYHCFTRLSPSDGPSSLQELLLQRLPHIPLASWKERFDFGGVYVNGREALADQQLPHPCKVEYYEPKFSIGEAATVFPAFEERFVVFRDEAVAVVYKPPRLPSMPAKEQRHFSLKASLDALLGVPVHMPSRLDVSAQGIVVVSLNPRTHAHLQQAFESRRVHKTYYLATTAAVPWEALNVDLPISRDPRHPVLRTVTGVDGQHAETRLSRIGTSSSEGRAVTVIRAEPVTGRTHQIRVHAASQSAPIFGDNFYGGAPASLLHLVSNSITFMHPLSGESIEVSLPKELTPNWLYGKQ
jgi:23S rRNA pseudouridine1911/1915/1917 synthase